MFGILDTADDIPVGVGNGYKVVFSYENRQLASAFYKMPWNNARRS